MIKRKQLLHIVTKLHSIFATSNSLESEDLQLAIKIVKILDRWVTCEGIHGLLRYKTMSNYFVRHLMGTPLETIPLSNRYKRLIQKALQRCTNRTVKIYWVSIFSAFRLYRLSKPVDTATITSGFKGSLISLFKTLNLNNLRTTKQSFRSYDQKWSANWKWHISGSSGPNGPLAYTRYLDDLRSHRINLLSLGLLILGLTLPYDNKREMVKSIRNAFLDSKKSESNSIHSKLISFPDKGGKMRVVALGDILSQSLLKTVHQRCNLVLRHLPQDGTFDQDSARLYVKKMSRENLPLASIDLTAATDRMPALFQVWVLIHLRILTPIQALAWYWVTTKRDFRVEGSLKYVRYTVGQPMGLLSSWPVMAITHHYLVRLSYTLSGRKHPEKARYCVLGDDLTLHDTGVSKHYLKLIHALGMDYSEDKTYIHKGAAEFAKSLFSLGDDLTPFPLALLIFRSNTVVSNVLAIIAECQRRKIPLTMQCLSGLFPFRWRNLVLLAALSPSRPRYSLDIPSREDQWLFLQFILIARIRYFSRLNTVRDSTHAFAFKDPGTSGYGLSSPYLQIGKDNSTSYPVTRLKDNNLNIDPVPFLGYDFISYCSVCWPNGLPPLGDDTLIPGPTWVSKRSKVILRSSLLEFNKLLPGYFTVRCVGHQVGEVGVTRY